MQVLLGRRGTLIRQQLLLMVGSTAARLLGAQVSRHGRHLADCQASPQQQQQQVVQVCRPQAQAASSSQQANRLLQ